MCAGFLLGLIFLGNLLSIVRLEFTGWLVLGVFALLAYPVMNTISQGLNKISYLYGKIKNKLKRRKQQ
jgi:hypothetical protein